MIANLAMAMASRIVTLKNHDL